MSEPIHLTVGGNTPGTSWSSTVRGRRFYQCPGCGHAGWRTPPRRGEGPLCCGDPNHNSPTRLVEQPPPGAGWRCTCSKCTWKRRTRWSEAVRGPGDTSAPADQPEPVMSLSLHVGPTGNRMHIKLVAHYAKRTGASFDFGTTESTFVFDDGLTVQIPTPFLAISDELGITPAVVKDGAAALRIDLTRWSPMRYGARGSHGFPFVFTGQDAAAKVCRAFDADPRTDWRQTVGEIEAWLREWGPPNGFHL